MLLDGSVQCGAETPGIRQSILPLARLRPPLSRARETRCWRKETRSPQPFARVVQDRTIVARAPRPDTLAQAAADNMPAQRLDTRDQPTDDRSGRLGCFQRFRVDTKKTRG